MQGHVYLVGAGPGDPALVTVRARELIASCEVLVYDFLVNPQLLSWAGEGCEQVCVGKKPGHHTRPQEDIQALLVSLAKEGKQVVRLKGGDPFIFGRGGEEAEALAEAGVPFEVIPAVTAALGAAAYAGVPLTHRDFTSSVCFLTGHKDIEHQCLHLDFARFAELGGTLCIYMGMGALAQIVEELLKGGMPEATPAAVVQWATLPRQRSLRSTVGGLVGAVEAAGLGSPAVVIIGKVAGVNPALNWFEARPLFGQRVVVTRTARQAGALSARLMRLGAEVLELPLIAVEEAPEQAARQVMPNLAHYQWIVFTSPNGVEFFFRKFKRHCKDLREIGGAQIACVGAATARALNQHLLEVDYVPETATAEALAEGLMGQYDLENYNVLLVTGNRNREVLRQKLEQGRAIVDELEVYQTQLADLSEHPAAEDFRQHGADWITFTSASTAESFAQQAAALQTGPEARTPKTLSIGPQTSARMKALGLPVHAEASEHNLDGLIACLIGQVQD